MRYLALALLLAGCTSYSHVNGALWLGGACLLSPVGAAMVGLVDPQDISDSTNQELINSRARVKATVEQPAAACYPRVTK